MKWNRNIMLEAISLAKSPKNEEFFCMNEKGFL